MQRYNFKLISHTFLLLSPIRSVEHLDDVFHKRMVITHCKHLCEGDYLIDDRGKNGASEFKGEWIQFGSDRFADWKSVLSYLLG